MHNDHVNTFGIIAIIILGALVFIGLGFVMSMIFKKKRIEVSLEDKLLSVIKYSLTYGFAFLAIGMLIVWIYYKNTGHGIEEYSPVQKELYTTIKSLNDDIESLKNENGTYTMLILNLDSLSRQMRNTPVLKIDKLDPNNADGNEITEKINEIRNVYVSTFYNILQTYGITAPNYDKNGDYGYGINKDKPDFKKQKLNEVYTAVDQQLGNYYYFNFKDTTDYKRNAIHLNTFLDSNPFVSVRNSIANIVVAKKNELTFGQGNSQAIIQKKEDYQKQLNEEIVVMKQRYIDKMLITYALPIFGGIVILLMLIPAVYKIIKLDTSTNGPDSIIRLIFEKGILLQMFTVFILTVTILILGIGQKISSEVMGTLLGGISVYVLQNSFKGESK